MVSTPGEYLLDEMSKRDSVKKRTLGKINEVLDEKLPHPAMIGALVGIVVDLAEEVDKLNSRVDDLNGVYGKHGN